MTRKDDVVVGCMTNYDFNAIKPWVNSLDRCGFEGHKVMLCYNVSAETIKELTDRNYTVLAFAQDEHGNAIYNNGKPFSIVVERFFHLWAMLKDLKGKHRYLMHTDVKDVVFQKNPSEYLELMLNDDPAWHKRAIIAASESMLYKDEDWGRQNMIDSFGQVVYEEVKDCEIVNAGTLSGHFDALVDFFLPVYMISVGGKIHNPDQAAVNLLVSRPGNPFDVTIVSPHQAWAAQLGTTNDPSKPHYTERLIRQSDGKNYCKDGIVYNYYDMPYYVVHQYDRHPEWREQILKRYS